MALYTIQDSRPRSKAAALVGGTFCGYFEDNIHVAADRLTALVDIVPSLIFPPQDGWLQVQVLREAVHQGYKPAKASEDSL